MKIKSFKDKISNSTWYLKTKDTIKKINSKTSKSLIINIFWYTWIWYFIILELYKKTSSLFVYDYTTVFNIIIASFILGIILYYTIDTIINSIRLLIDKIWS